MIRNDLKEKLDENWRSKFSHRDYDQADYEFGKFEVDGKKINLVLNPKTLDIMEYYYDDFDENTWIEINKNLITDFNTTNRAWINKKYQLKTQYYVGKSKCKFLRLVSGAHQPQPAAPRHRNMQI